MKILVTNATRHSGMSVIRALAGKGHQVIGADDRRLPFGLKSRHTIALKLLPDEWSDAFPDALRALLEAEKPDVFLPFSGSKVASEQRHAIGALTRLAVPEFSSYCNVADKQRLLDLCHALHVPACRRLSVEEAQQRLRVAPAGAVSPVVVRPCRDFGGGAGVEIVACEADLEAAIVRIERDFGASVISTYIPGPDSNMRSLTLLFDRSGKLIRYFVQRKLRLWPPRVGISIMSVSANDDGLVKAVLPLFEHIGWIGPAEAEFKVDEATGVPHLLEINPRLPGTVRFATACGVDFANLWCDIALGEPVEPRFDYVRDRLWLNTMAFARSLRRQKSTIRMLSEIRRRGLSGVTLNVPGFDDPGYLMGKAMLALTGRSRFEAN